VQLIQTHWEKRCLDITYILGPPGPPDLRERFEALAARTGRPVHEHFFEVTSQTLTNVVERDDSGSSYLEELVSLMLDVPVRIERPFVTYYWEGGIHYPALQIHQENIRAADGSRLSIPLNDPRIREGVTHALANVLQLEWVKAIIVGAGQPRG
jgi:hypothetical protein